MNSLRVIARLALMSSIVLLCASSLVADDANWRDIIRSDALLDRSSLDAIAKRASLDAVERTRLALAFARIDALRKSPQERTQALTQLAGERARFADALATDPRAGSVLLDIAEDALLNRLAQGTVDAECAVGIPTKADFDFAVQLARESLAFTRRARTLLGVAPVGSEDLLTNDRQLRAPTLEALALALISDSAELMRLGILDADPAALTDSLTDTQLAQRFAPLEPDLGKLPPQLRESALLATARCATDATRAALLARLERATDPVVLAQVEALRTSATDTPPSSSLTPNALGLLHANASVRSRLLAAQHAHALDAWKLLLDAAPDAQRGALEDAIVSRVSSAFARSLIAEKPSPFARAIAGAALYRAREHERALQALAGIEGDRTALHLALPLLAQLAAAAGDAQASADALFAFAQTFPQSPRALEGVQLAIEISLDAKLSNLGVQLEGVARAFGAQGERVTWLALACDLALDAGDSKIALRRADLLNALGGDGRAEAACRRAEARAIDLLATALTTSTSEDLQSQAQNLAREATQAEALLPVQSPLRARLALVDAAALTTLGRWAEAVDRAEIALRDAALPARVKIAAFRVWLAASIARGDIIVVPSTVRECLATERALLEDVARSVASLVSDAEQRARAGETDAAKTRAKSTAAPLALLLVTDARAPSAELSESMRADAGRAFAAAGDAERAALLLAPLVALGRAGRNGTLAYALIVLASQPTDPTERQRAFECFKALAPLHLAPESRDEIWWLAQLAMLEMTATTDATRRDALTRIQRLRVTDATFGSASAKRRFEALEQSLRQ